MKHFLSLGALTGIAMLAIAGCSDDSIAPTDINTHFEPRRGDTFTYARYERDMTNARREDTKTIHKWAVIDADLTYEGKTNVARVVQMNFAADGTTSLGPNDTLYIRSAIDGQVFMNALQQTVSRVPIAAGFASLIPFTWVQISDTKIAGTLMYDGLLTSQQTGVAASQQTTDVQVPISGNNVRLRVTLNDQAYHKGKTPVTVGTTSYANAFRTDHTLKMLATAIDFPNLPALINNDSLHMRFEVDVENGLLRQVVESDSITVNLLGQVSTQAAPGFEMELINVVRGAK